MQPDFIRICLHTVQLQNVGHTQPTESHLAFFYLSPLRKQNTCQPGQLMLPRELSTMQETPEAQPLLQMRPLCEWDRQLRRCNSLCTSRASGTRCQQGANTQIQPTAFRVSSSFGMLYSSTTQLFYHFKKETLNCSYY